MRPLMIAALVLPFLLPAQPRRSTPASALKRHGWKVNADLEAQLAKWKRVELPFAAEGLSPRERQMVEKLVEASQHLNQVFWLQNDPEGLRLYNDISASRNPDDQKMFRMLRINGGRYDLLAENKTFACRSAEYHDGCPTTPPGRALYPVGLTRAQLEQYVQQHPGRKPAIYSPYSVVYMVTDPPDRPIGAPKVAWKLNTTPYVVAYHDLLHGAARALREAAALSDDAAFAHFLTLRADALLSDDYYVSDIAWVELSNPKFDIIFAPYETYLDDLMGIKTSYGAAVLIRNEDESAKLALYQKYVAEIQEALPLEDRYKPSKRGHLTPMEVMDAPFRAGDLRYGYQAVADNLPNDPRIHAEKGTKKIFFKNFMDARVNYVILPLARLLMRDDQAALASAAGYLAATVMHEICHGLGPDYALVNGKKVDIREAIGPAYSGLEEAKADVVGMYALKWLVDHGALPQERLHEYYASYVAGIFRTARFGIGEAHGRAEMMEFNFYAEQGAITRDSAGHYVVDFEKMPAAIARLATELLQQEATGDRARAEAWFKRYDVMPPELAQAMQKAGNVPVDFEPIFHWGDGVK